MSSWCWVEMFELFPKWEHTYLWQRMTFHMTSFIINRQRDKKAHRNTTTTRSSRFQNFFHIFPDNPDNPDPNSTDTCGWDTQSCTQIYIPAIYRDTFFEFLS